MKKNKFCIFIAMAGLITFGSTMSTMTSCSKNNFNSNDNDENRDYRIIEYYNFDSNATVLSYRTLNLNNYYFWYLTTTARYGLLFRAGDSESNVTNEYSFVCGGSTGYKDTTLAKKMCERFNCYYHE